VYAEQKQEGLEMGCMDMLLAGIAGNLVTTGNG